MITFDSVFIPRSEDIQPPRHRHPVTSSTLVLARTVAVDKVAWCSARAGVGASTDNVGNADLDAVQDTPRPGAPSPPRAMTVQRG